jgi:hypothetical protein
MACRRSYFQRACLLLHYPRRIGVGHPSSLIPSARNQTWERGALLVSEANDAAQSWIQVLEQRNTRQTGGSDVTPVSQDFGGIAYVLVSPTGFEPVLLP